MEQPHIYAAGDATLDIGLVSVAEEEGRMAVEHMFGCKVSMLDGNARVSAGVVDSKV